MSSRRDTRQHRIFLDCRFPFAPELQKEMDSKRCVGCFVKNKYEEMQIEVWKAKKEVAEIKNEAEELRLEVDLLRTKLRKYESNVQENNTGMSKNNAL